MGGRPIEERKKAVPEMALPSKVLLTLIVLLLESLPSNYNEA
jgi:hypothetical protein